jgi:phosphoribosylaminoimidazole-succinocarboxamide synthase
MRLAELGTAFVRSGKVRDLFAIDDDRLLLVASDRISAFDVVLPTEIPDKGKVLTGLSRYWFRETEAAGLVRNHLLNVDMESLPAPFTASAAQLRGRAMICRRARVLPVEVIVRGYLSGTGWKDYLRTGAVCGIPLPSGLRESERLREPLFTPSTKAEVGHDENIDFDAVCALIGGELAERVRSAALALYAFGAARAERAGIILADTKFEFGVVNAAGTSHNAPAEANGDVTEAANENASGDMLLLIDEVMTPDSSRFWDAATYEAGRAQPSYDKQYVRDWLEGQAWDKTPPGPELPGDVVDGTRRRYVEAFERITGVAFRRYVDEDVVA